MHCLPEDNFKNATAEEATYPHRNHTDIKGSAGIITVQHGGLGAPYQVLRQTKKPIIFMCFDIT